VLADRATDPYRTLTAGTQPDVQLVAINGYPIYGHAGVDDGALAVNREPIQVSPRLEGGLPLRDTASPIRIPAGSKRLATAVRETLYVARLEAPSANSQS
jgi:hypothetical protein